MLSENIRSNRKKMNLSQDELAEKIGVSRQSVSFWETGQTQPTIDNIIALSKTFNISSDMLLGNNNNINTVYEDKPHKKRIKTGWVIAIGVIAAVVISSVIFAVILIISNDNEKPDKSNAVTAYNNTDFDLFSYCKEFAIEKGTLNGDYCIYQQPAKIYGGYDDEYFSISYWADSNMVEFSLHCPLSETQSHNFYLRMRGGYNGEYEYLSSKYYRDTGESIRSATGYINPAVFSDSYPIPCDIYDGNADGQNQFMEETRVGMCDLIRCLKNFVTEEKMECNFSDFDFVNF